jgi:hypothetical protein
MCIVLILFIFIDFISKVALSPFRTSPRTFFNSHNFRPAVRAKFIIGTSGEFLTTLITQNNRK